MKSWIARDGIMYCIQNGIPVATVRQVAENVWHAYDLTQDAGPGGAKDLWQPLLIGRDFRLPGEATEAVEKRF